MSEAIDPILSDASSDPDLRSLLSHAREDLPDAGHVEAMWGKLGPLLPPTPGGAGGGGATVAATAKTASGVKIAMGVVLAAAIGGGIVATRPRDVPPQPSPSVLLAAPSAPAPPPEPALVETSAPMPSASAVIAPPRVMPPASVAPTDDRTEIAILRDAQSALGADPARALRLVSEAEQSFPRGQLGQEREMIRIQALFAQGKRADAEARVEAFRTRWPNSAHLPRLDDLLR